MHDPADLLLSPSQRGIPLTVIPADGWRKARAELDAEARAWTDAHGFKAQPGKVIVVPGLKGSIGRVLAGAPGDADPFSLSKLCRSLPENTYALDGIVGNAELFALGWCLEAYGFDVYGKTTPPLAKLVCPKSVDREAVLRAAKATYLVRDLINTPANDMGPDALEEAALAVA